MNPDNITPKIKVLLVEDDYLIRTLLKAKLEKNGFTVEIAVDGTVVLDLARKQKPDLIALDILMPVVNGYQVLDLLKQDAELSEIPVVIMSNLGQEGEIEKCIRKGASSFIIKANYTPSQMVDELRNAYLRSHK
jgi:CheY-like chemotaxis protein